MCSPPCCCSFWCQVWLDSGSVRRSVGACHVGRDQGKLSAGCTKAVAGARIREVLEHQDHALIEGTAPGVEFAVGPALRLAVLGALAADVAEDDRVAAGFGDGVPAVAELVSVAAEPEAQRGLDDPPEMGGAVQRGDLGGVADAGGWQAGDADRLGDVLGDVVSDCLAGQRGLGARADDADVGLTDRTGPGPTGRWRVPSRRQMPGRRPARPIA